NGVSAYALAEPGKQYAVYFSRVVAEKGADGKETGRFFEPQPGKPITITLALPPGTYAIAWLDPRAGKRQVGKVKSEGELRLDTQNFEEDLALRLTPAPD